MQGVCCGVPTSMRVRLKPYCTLFAFPQVDMYYLKKDTRWVVGAAVSQAVGRSRPPAASSWISFQ